MRGRTRKKKSDRQRRQRKLTFLNARCAGENLLFGPPATAAKNNFLFGPPAAPEKITFRTAGSAAGKITFRTAAGAGEKLTFRTAAGAGDNLLLVPAPALEKIKLSVCLIAEWTRCFGARFSA